MLDITDLTEGDGERGLLGLAFDPDGDLAYVNYTDNGGGTIIAEYPVDADGTFRTATRPACCWRSSSRTPTTTAAT